MWRGPLGKDSSRSSVNTGFLWAFLPLLPLPLSPSLLLSPSSCEQSPGTRLGSTSPDCLAPWSYHWVSAPSPSPQGPSPPATLEAGVCAKCVAHSLRWALA